MIPKIDPDRISWTDEGMHRTNDLTFTQVFIDTTTYILLIRICILYVVILKIIFV